jgi:hypothetical protein
MYKTPEKAVEKGFLSEIYRNRPSIGIIIDESSSNQIAYDAIRSVQNFLPNRAEVCFFHQDFSPPDLTPTTGWYHTSLLSGYKGHLICSSVSSVLDALEMGKNKIIYYIRDMMDFSEAPKDTLDFILGSPNIIKVSCGENFSKFLLQNYSNAIIQKEVNENFDMNIFYKILFGEN